MIFCATHVQGMMFTEVQSPADVGMYTRLPINRDNGIPVFDGKNQIQQYFCVCVGHFPILWLGYSVARFIGLPHPQAHRSYAAMCLWLTYATRLSALERR